MVTSLSCHAFAHDETTNTESLNQLYHDALASFEKKEYVNCVKQFTRFRAIGAEYLNKYQEIKKGVNERISICEKKITKALSFYTTSFNAVVDSNNNETDNDSDGEIEVTGIDGSNCGGFLGCSMGVVSDLDYAILDRPNPNFSEPIDKAQSGLYYGDKNWNGHNNYYNYPSSSYYGPFSPYGYNRNYYPDYRAAPSVYPYNAVPSAKPYSVPAPGTRYRW